MNKKIAVILAAGKSSRFNDSKSKLLQPFGDTTIIDCVVQSILEANYSPIIVVGHQKELVQKELENKHFGLCEFFNQTEQLGTGHAFFSAMPKLEEATSSVLVINGDNPFVTSDLIINFTKYFNENNLDAALVSAIADNPFGYGRIIETGSNSFLIIEEKALAEEQKTVCLINGGIYLFSQNFLITEFANFISKNKFLPGEINITDLFNLAESKKLKMGHFMSDFSLVFGINDLGQYHEAKIIFEEKRGI